MTAGDVLPWLQVVVVPALIALGRWLHVIRRDAADEDRVLHGRVGDLGKAFADFRVKAAETYVAKTAIDDLKHDMDRRLERMEGKIDQIISNGRGKGGG